MQAIDAVRAESLPELTALVAALLPVDAVAIKQSAVGPEVSPASARGEDQGRAGRGRSGHLFRRATPRGSETPCQHLSILRDLLRDDGPRIHVVVGMVMIGWLILRGMKGTHPSTMLQSISVGSIGTSSTLSGSSSSPCSTRFTESPRHAVLKDFPMSSNAQDHHGTIIRSSGTSFRCPFSSGPRWPCSF